MELFLKKAEKEMKSKKTRSAVLSAFLRLDRLQKKQGLGIGQELADLASKIMLKKV